MTTTLRIVVRFCLKLCACILLFTKWLPSAGGKVNQSQGEEVITYYKRQANNIVRFVCFASMAKILFTIITRKVSGKIKKASSFGLGTIHKCQRAVLRSRNYLFRLQLQLSKSFRSAPTLALWVPVFTAFKWKSRFFTIFSKEYRLNSLFWSYSI